MSIKQIGFSLIIFVSWFSQAQTLNGRVIDSNTKAPIETATVYFDNTTIGVSTNANGEFSIVYNDAIQSVLVVSFLGFEKQVITDYRTLSYVTVELKEQIDVLDEVFLTDNDGLTRIQKIKQFKKEFLGTSANAKSCKILNEDDIILRYHKPSKTLTATSKNPVLVLNTNLQYEIAYDLIDFEIKYKYVDEKQDIFNINSVIYTGTSFYKSIGKIDAEKLDKFRQKALNGSVQHFMRALYKEDLEAEGFQIFHKSFIVKPWDFFTVSTHENPNLKQVSLKDKVVILYNKKAQSSLQVHSEFFVIDQYGNYAPINTVLFSGEMGSQRIGDSLPFDFEPLEVD